MRKKTEAGKARPADGVEGRGGSSIGGSGGHDSGGAPDVDWVGDFWCDMDARTTGVVGISHPCADVGDSRGGGTLAMSADAGRAMGDDACRHAGISWRIYRTLSGSDGVSESAGDVGDYGRGAGMRAEPGDLYVARRAGVADAKHKRARNARSLKVKMLLYAGDTARRWSKFKI